MNQRIRRADLLQDRLRLIDFMRQYLTPNSDSRRYDWLYQKNPAGKAQVWLMEDSSAGQIVGAAASFPRKFYVLGKETLGFVLGDFCIHPSYRSMGPAIQLQRACLQEIDSAYRALGYDLPSQGMLAVHRRLGVQTERRSIRFAKPLKTDRKFANRINSPLLARTASSLGNGVLRWRDRRRQSPSTESLGWHKAPFGVEFSSLAATAATEHEICLARTAEYLNWRYLEHPSQRFEILTARRSDILVAYLVLTQEGEDARIVDLFGENDWKVLGNLLMHAVDLLRARGVITVSAPLIESHPWTRLFTSLGFVERDSCPVILFDSACTSARASQTHQASWLLMDGDRDS